MHDANAQPPSSVCSIIRMRVRSSTVDRSGLRDRIGPNRRILFVGINPGMRSAAVGHHFAGPSNRFWKLLYEARLVPEAVTWRDDDRLREWGLGITNLAPRATPGIGDLHATELTAGRRALVAKIRRHKPAIVAL